MLSALAGVLLAGGGEVGGPLLPVPAGHLAGHVTGALGETVQLGQALTPGAGGLDTVPGQAVVGGQRAVEREAGADAAQAALVVTGDRQLVSRINLQTERWKFHSSNLFQTELKYFQLSYKKRKKQTAVG